MNAKTHIAIAKRAHELLPEVVRDFLNVTEDEISFWSVFPDKLDKDNLDYGYWMHSRKMTKTKKKGFVWKGGSLSGVFLALRWNFRTFYRTARFSEARETLLKFFHYCTDACTLPHVVSKEADFLHKPFEKDMSKNVFMLVREIRVSPQPIPYKHSIYDSATELMQSVYNEQKEELIDLYEKGGSINQRKEFKISILRKCIQACVDYVTHVYLEISKEDDYLKEVK